jgi:hypothetical protein
VTDTPPGSEPYASVPYVPGRLGQEPPTSGIAVGPQADGGNAPGPAAAEMPRRRSKIPLLIGGLTVLVIGLAGAVAVLATRGSTGTPAAAAPTSWTPIFATTTPAAPYSPPPPKEISVPFGEVLTLTSNAGDEVHYTVAADRTYTKTKYGTKPKNGLLYGIKVTVEVVEGSVYAYAGDFALVAADGTVYEGSGVQVDGGLDGVDLNRKQKASGVVVFDVPPAAPKGARIELREGSTNQGFWEVP